VIYCYKPEILVLLERHGVKPKPTTPPTVARAVVNDIYRYELRLLRDRYLVGEFSKQTYYDKVVEVRNRYPVMTILTRHWVSEADDLSTYRA
jgi:hypothetical protein